MPRTPRPLRPDPTHSPTHRSCLRDRAIRLRSWHACNTPRSSGRPCREPRRRPQDPVGRAHTGTNTWHCTAKTSTPETARESRREWIARTGSCFPPECVLENLKQRLLANRLGLRQPALARARDLDGLEQYVCKRVALRRGGKALTRLQLPDALDQSPLHRFGWSGRLAGLEVVPGHARLHCGCPPARNSWTC